ncbi:hypothetical protein ABZW18_14980 [Streptomyces sp. NPDC004647]|uniref:hypothetical protein n=1 Tax=Streptomyces sp. NPDC004647 TaxID=3154671 RepID=UPI0033BCDEA9
MDVQELRRHSPGKRGRNFVAVRAVLALCVGGALIAACGSEEKKPPTQESAREVLKERLVATEKRLPSNEVLRTFQELADAMAAARDAGMSQDAMLGEVLASHVRQWKRPGGMEESLANNQALGDQARAGHVVTVPAPSGQNDKPHGGAAGTRAAGLGPAAQPTPTKSQEVVGIFGNGVLNTDQEALQAATALGGALNQKIDQAYNVSSKNAALSFANGQAMGRVVRDQQTIPEVKNYVDMLVQRRGVPAGGTAEAIGADVFLRKLPGLLYQYGGSEQKAQENTAYPALMAQARAALKAGKPVILISHSEGGFPVRQAKTDLDKEIAEAREREGKSPAPSPVGALYIAPPFGNETKGSLNRDDSKYVLLRGDAINIISPFLRSTVDSTGKQPSADSLDPRDAITLHLLNTYLQDGTESRAQIIKAFNELKDHVCKQPAVTGLKSRPGRRQACPVPPPPGEPSERPTGQPPGEPSERTPGDTPGQQSPEETPEQPTTEQPPETQEQPTPGGTPEEPPGQTPEPPQQPPGHTP